MMWTSFESNEITNIIKALVKVQSDLENLTKDTKAFKYKYVKLDKLVDAVKEPLNKNGIFFSQMPIGSGNEVGVRTTLYHTSGEWIATQIVSPIAELQGQNLYQSQGSAITYLRRYSLAAMLGLCDTDDTDAQGKVEKTYKVQKVQSDDLDF